MSNEPVTLQEKAKQLALLKQIKEHHEHMAELASSRYAKLATEVFREMTDSDVPSIAISGDIFADKKKRNITPAIKLAPRVVDQEKFYEWLRAGGHGALIREYVFPKSIESLCNQMAENNLAFPPKEILDVFKVETANVRRS